MSVVARLEQGAFSPKWELASLRAEAIVFAGAASLHRQAAFDAADYVMVHLKIEALSWKREIGEGGAEWIEPTDADCQIANVGVDA